MVSVSRGRHLLVLKNSIWKLETQQLQRGFYNSKIQKKVHTD